jgi:putative spermidine/putrescine transport system substrate-binding protein
LAAVFPKRGTALSADLWVQPALAEKAEASEALSQTIAAWCEYGLSVDRAAQISQLMQGMSPSLAQVPQISEALRESGLLVPEGDSLGRSEFLLPQLGQTVDQWRSVWETMRND